VLVNAIPGTLANVTGIFKQNVDMLTGGVPFASLHFIWLTILFKA
jgi:hypothetical protein